MIIPVLAGLGALACMSNPRRRKARRNPSPSTTTVHKIGATTVIINRWRNRNATAFISVQTDGPHGVKVWEAKSQGPSAGGYSKPTQAAERVYHKITGEYPSWGGEELEKIAEAAAAALAARTRTNPRVSKTKKVWILQGNYGYGWDDLLEEDTWAAMRPQVKSYRENERTAAHRVITRRVSKDNPRRRTHKRRR
jgi:hypothetical protein